MIKPMDFVLSKNDKTEPDLSFNDKSEQPHNTREIIAESLGMSTGKAKLGGDHGNQYKKVAGLSKNDKPGNPPHNTREIIAGNDIEAQKLALDFCTDPLGYRLSTASPEELRQTPERRRLIEYLREHGGHGRTSEIAAALGIDDSTASRLLRRLADDGLIVRTQYGGYAL